MSMVFSLSYELLKVLHSLAVSMG